MGKNKTTKWFHSLLGSKKYPGEFSASPAPDAKENRKKSKWGLLKSSTSNGNAYKNEENPLTNPPVESLDANKHAIAVAAATAAVAEAALAAAKAAAEVVRLTSGSKTINANASVYVTGERRRELAAIRIQSSFRAYLARRALRALKGLVKLQALVRGHIVRKQSSDMLRRMQAMARIQARASAHRAHTSDSTNLGIKYSNPLQTGVSNLRKNEQSSNSAKRDGPNQKIFGSRSNMSNVRTKSTWLGSNWLDRWMEEYTWNNQNSSFPQETRRRDDEISDKILEIDTWKPRLHPKPSERPFKASQSQYFPVWNGNGQGSATFDTLSKHSTKSGKPSPCIPSSSRRSPYSPTRSECSKSLFSEYLSHPSYMANTESSLAKLRSQSAPRPRMQYEELHTSTRLSRDLWDIDMNSERGSSLCTNYTTKAYPYHGHLNKPGTPIRGSAANFGSTYGYRHYN